MRTKTFSITVYDRSSGSMASGLAVLEAGVVTRFVKPEHIKKLRYIPWELFNPVGMEECIFVDSLGRLRDDAVKDISIEWKKECFTKS